MSPSNFKRSEWDHPLVSTIMRFKIQLQLVRAYMHIDPNRFRILMVYIHVPGEHTLRVKDLDHLEHCMQLIKITNNIFQKYE